MMFIKSLFKNTWKERAIKAEKAMFALWHSTHGVQPNRPQDRRSNGQFGTDVPHWDYIKATKNGFSLIKHLEGQNETIN